MYKAYSIYPINFKILSLIWIISRIHSVIHFRRIVFAVYVAEQKVSGRLRIGGVEKLLPESLKLLLGDRVERVALGVLIDWMTD